ncbi:MAG TPA: ABC transporter permease [Steroidobacteraceae bacterium]|nr:ABC transporter permease [Steroidobacteraceae bacterium]
MELGLLFRALIRHKAIVAVLILEFAVTLAILSNALALAAARVQVLKTPSGVREPGLIIATPSATGPLSANLDAAVYDDLRALAANQPGVRSVSMIGYAPLSGGDRWTGIVSTVPGTVGHPIDVAVYTGDQWLPATLGLSLSTGRWFASQEISPAMKWPQVKGVHLVLLTESLAQKLFKGGASVGNTVYMDGTQATVVGILASLSRGGYYGGNRDQDSVILPMRPALAFGPALGIRMSDDWRGSMDVESKTIREVLNRRTQGVAVWNVLPYKTLRDRVFTADRAALGLLAAILIAVIGVAANGIAASSAYWVHQRVRQTWIRRALGATRRHVVTYFLAENAIICAVGVAFGMGLGLAVNLALINYLHLTRMSMQPLIAGAVLALLIGQLAVLRSAIGTAAPMRSARIRPQTLP